MSNENSPEDLREVTDVARRVLLAMGKWRVPATPENYGLWYEYIRGDNPGLNHDIDRLAAAGKPFTHEVCDTLYSQHVAPAKVSPPELNGHSAQTEQAQAKAHEILRKILHEILATGDAASDYGDSLNNFSDTLADTGDASNIQGLVRGLLSETSRMADQNEQFHTRLEEAKKQTEELRQQLESVQAVANTDTLTGLANRRCLEERLREILHANKPGTTCVAMLDADHFKAFNDTYGHSVGDQVLKMIAAAFNEVLVEPCFGARYGGEEFTLVFPNMNVEVARAASDAIRESIAQKRLRRTKSDEPLRQVTVSIGLTTNISGDTPESIVERADAALYEAKADGRNCVREAVPNLPAYGTA